MILIVLIVACCANFGYGLNELYDRFEDSRGGRANVANERGGKIVWIATLLSALIALILSFIGAGLFGLFMTVVELLLPISYSIPPLRTKERAWLAVFSDAIAAHVYPAVIAMSVIAHLEIRVFEPFMVAAVLIWASAVGLRGIISHLLWSFEHDRSVGLTTIAHISGEKRLTLLILIFLLPIEVISFGLMMIQAKVGLLMVVIIAAYLIKEFSRSFSAGVRLSFKASYHGKVYHSVTERYVPFVDEVFYKKWGPLFAGLSIAIATGSVGFVIFSILYVALFWCHFCGIYIGTKTMFIKIKQKLFVTQKA
jgi:4-hydroxybenzoate polyprenyltransferase